jgi:hypothetical protein
MLGLTGSATAAETFARRRTPGLLPRPERRPAERGQPADDEDIDDDASAADLVEAVSNLPPTT